MNKTRVVLIYFLLTFLLIGSSVLLAYQVRHYRYEREDPVAEFREKEVPTGEIQEKIKLEEKQEQQATLLVFNQSKAFMALATPIPRPTPTPVPPPTPTPVIPGRNWTVNYVAGTFVSLRGYAQDQQDIIAKISDVITDRVWGDFKIISATSRPEMMVTVQHVATGKMGVIKQQPQVPQPK